MNGIYEVYLPGCLSPLSCAKRVTCDLQTDGGGWTVRNVDNKLNLILDIFVSLVSDYSAASR